MFLRAETGQRLARVTDRVKERRTACDEELQREEEANVIGIPYFTHNQEQLGR